MGSVLENAAADLLKELTMLAQNVNLALEDQMRKDNVNIERDEEKAEQRPRRRRKS